MKIIDVYPNRDIDKYNKLTNIAYITIGIGCIISLAMILVLIIQNDLEGMFAFSILTFLFIILFLYVRGIKNNRLIIKNNIIQCSNWFGKLKTYNLQYKHLNISLKRKPTNIQVLTLSFRDKSNRLKLRFKYRLNNRIDQDVMINYLTSHLVVLDTYIEDLYFFHKDVIVNDNYQNIVKDDITIETIREQIKKNQKCFKISVYISNGIISLAMIVYSFFTDYFLIFIFLGIAMIFITFPLLKILNAPRNAILALSDEELVKEESYKRVKANLEKKKGIINKHL